MENKGVMIIDKFYNNILRKFTINELEKLQTLPIDYTCGVPYRSRIKSIGNGWTTDVIVEILKQFKFDTYIYYLGLAMTIFSLIMYFNSFYAKGYFENLKNLKK